MIARFRVWGLGFWFLVWGLARAAVCVCVCVCVRVCVVCGGYECVREKERESVCACVCERASVSECECECGYLGELSSHVVLPHRVVGLNHLHRVSRSAFRISG